MKKPKSETIQVMRGIAIVMIVIQHSIGRVVENGFDWALMLPLNHISVPVFMVISGYLFGKSLSKYRQADTSVFLKRKILPIAVPYLIWFSVLPAFVRLAAAVTGRTSILGLSCWSFSQYLWNLFTYADYYVQHLWYLYILIWYLLISWGLSKFWKPGLLILVAAGLLCWPIYQANLHFIVSKLSLHYLNFLFGWLAAERHWEERIKRLNVFLPSLAVLTGCFVMERMVTDSFTYTYWGNTVFGLTGILVVLYVSEHLPRWSPGFQRVLKAIGDESFPIYLIHNPYVVWIVPMILLRVGAEKYLTVTVSCVLGIVIPWGCDWILKKVPQLRNLLFGGKAC